MFYYFIIDLYFLLDFIAEKLATLFLLYFVNCRLIKLDLHLIDYNTIEKHQKYCKKYNDNSRYMTDAFFHVMSCQKWVFMHIIIELHEWNPYPLRSRSGYMDWKGREITVR